MSAPETQRNVLIVEDNRDIARLLQMHLRDIDCAADIACDGPAGIETYKSKAYDLVVLDLMLPGVDGLSVCKQIRAGPNYVPILMLTAKSTEVDRVVGLELGADDYVTKPFSIPELLARIKALFRRVEALGGKDPADASPMLSCGELSIDAIKRRVALAGNDVQVTAKEFELLLHFARNPGRVFTRAQLLDTVWGYTHAGYEHTVNSHINRLRAKIERDPTKPHYVLTVWGVGYKFVDD